MIHREEADPFVRSHGRPAQVRVGFLRVQGKRQPGTHAQLLNSALVLEDRDAVRPVMPLLGIPAVGAGVRRRRADLNDTELARTAKVDATA